MTYRQVYPVAAGAAVLAAGFFGLSKASSGARYSGSRINENGLKNYTFVDSKKFELLNAAVILRHGARTPNYYVDSKFEMPDWESGNGYVDMLPELDYEIVLKDIKSNSFIEEKDVADGYVEYIKEKSYRGQLTLVGQEQSLTLGNELRRIYMDGYKILKPEFNDSEIYCRTTKFPRTLYTLKGILCGIYGLTSFDLCHRPLIHTTSISIDPLYPNPKVCSVLEKFLESGSSEIAKDPEIMKMKCMLSSILGVEGLRYTVPGRKPAQSKEMKKGERENACNRRPLNKNVKVEEEAPTIVTAVATGGDVPIYAVRDDFYSRMIHDFSVPAAFPSLLPELNRLSSEEVLYESLGGSVEWEDRIALLVSPVLNVIKSSMKTVIENSQAILQTQSCVSDMKASLMKKKSAMKMQILSCHDTTLVPILLCLRLYDGQWPQFMSNLIFELFKETCTGDLYVRMVYNGKVQQPIITEQSCGTDNEYSRSGLVPYADFLKFLDNYTIPDDKYSSSCDKALKLFTSGKPVTRDQFI